jgi:hypothetical protein
MKSVIRRALFLTTSLLATTSFAAPTTFSSYGLIDSGSDPSGIFGSPTTDLKGQTYSLALTLDPDFLSYHDQYISAAQGKLSGGSATLVTTVGGHANSYSLDINIDANGMISVVNALTQYGTTRGYSYDGIDMRINGQTSDGFHLMGQTGVDSEIFPFLSNTSFNQTLTRKIDAGYRGYAYFEYYAINPKCNCFDPYTKFYGTPTSVSINSVPIPETYTLMVAGLSFLGVLVHRRK